MAESKNPRVDVFENYSIPRAVFTLSLPTIAGSLVSLAYSMADTYFVGLLNDPVQTAAVTLAAPVLLAFNAINNLFGVGCSSMMSRALGRGDLKTLRQSSSFGFWGSLTGGLLFSILATLFISPLLVLLGCDASTSAPTSAYLGWTVSLGAIPAILNVVCAYMVRSEGSALHAFLQHADLAAAAKDPEGEGRRQLEKKLLAAEQHRSLPWAQLRRFFESDAFARMQAAQNALREYAFITSVPAEQLSPGASGARVLVQGVADVVLEFENHLEILDYKTDRGKDEAQLVSAYAAQLRMYAAAIGRRFAKPVTKLTLYSFALGREIDVPLG